MSLNSKTKAILIYGSIGQFLLLPSSLYMINGLGWATALWVFSALGSLIIPLSLALKEKRTDGAVDFTYVFQMKYLQPS